MTSKSRYSESLLILSLLLLLLLLSLLLLLLVVVVVVVVVLVVVAVVVSLLSTGEDYNYTDCSSITICKTFNFLIHFPMGKNPCNHGQL